MHRQANTAGVIVNYCYYTVRNVFVIDVKRLELSKHLYTDSGVSRASSNVIKIAISHPVGYLGVHVNNIDNPY